MFDCFTWTPSSNKSFIMTNILAVSCAGSGDMDGMNKVKDVTILLFFHFKYLSQGNFVLYILEGEKHSTVIFLFPEFPKQFKWH